MIQVLKLITGEEILADVTEQESTLELKSPVRVAIAGQQVALIPYSMLSKSETFSISKAHVLFQADPDDEPLNIYNAQYGSGLVIPSPQLKLVRD